MNIPIATFLLEALESELANAEIHAQALPCARDERLKSRWTSRLAEARDDARTYADLLARLHVDSGTLSSGRTAIRRDAAARVRRITTAFEAQGAEGAEAVACECTASCDTTCQLNWQLVSELSRQLQGEARRALQAAHDRARGRQDQQSWPPAMRSEWTRWEHEVASLASASSRGRATTGQRAAAARSRDAGQAD